MRKPVATLGHVRGRGPKEMPGGHDVWEVTYLSYAAMFISLSHTSTL